MNKFTIIEVDGYQMDEKIPETFRIIQGNNGEKLITPEFGTGNESWKDKSHLWLRSLHIGPDDTVISVGFPKFFNCGDGPREFQITEKDLLDKKDLVATLKYDGSLLCRYVQDGIVKFRTRGALQVGLDNKNEIDKFIKWYPKLNDPSVYPNISLLFEWCSPRNQIVIKYDKPQIILVGAVSYEKNTEWYNNKFSLLTIKELEQISENLSSFDDYLMQCVEYFYLKNNTEVIALIERIKNDKIIEGYVIRMDGEQNLVKVKSDHYFILHSLKSNLTSESITELFLSWNQPSFEEFKKKFESSYDYETFAVALPAISSVYDGLKIANKIFDHIKNFVEINKNLSRKEFAIKAKQAYQDHKLAACFSLLDNKPLKNNFIKSLILQNSKQYSFSMFKKNIPQDELEES